MNFIILANGEMKDYLKYQPLFNNCQVICADGGVNHTPKLGVTPHMVVGDMDSADPDLLVHLELAGTKLVRCPRDKDEMDTELAIAEAVNQGATSITLLGCTGNRLDHTLAAIHLLIPLTLKGIEGKIISDDHYLTVITPNNPLIFRGTIGNIISLLPLTSVVAGVTSSGVKWPLQNAVLELGKPYAVSNETTEDEVNVSVSEGVLLFINIDKIK